MTELTDKLCELTLDGFNSKLELFYIGSQNVGYKFYYKGNLLFKGTDYKPSPMFSVDSLDSCVGLLGFLTVQPGDTDDEYFKDYTPEQIEYSKSYDAEQLKGLIGDYENGDEYSKQAKKYFKQGFNYQI